MNSDAEMLQAMEHVAVDWRDYRPCGELTRLEPDSPCLGN
jgi:hypothetical protein